jgi:transcriptional regulator with XRE-family HTH domain
MTMEWWKELRAWREEKGLTQYQVAEMFGCPQQVLSHMELGKRPTGRMARVMDHVTDGRVARAVTRPDLFGPLDLSGLPTMQDVVGKRRYELTSGGRRKDAA